MNTSYVHTMYQKRDTCWCGHDYAVHIIGATAGASLCNLCTSTLNGQPNPHIFTSRSEANPKIAFLQSAPRGYNAAGGLGQGLIFGSGTLGSTGAIGQTVFTLNVVTTPQTIVPGPGWVMQVGAGTSGNPQRIDSYQVLNVVRLSFNNPPSSSQWQITIAPPGLRFGGQGPNTGLRFEGTNGSTMGPGLPSNGQRAG